MVPAYVPSSLDASVFESLAEDDIRIRSAASWTERFDRRRLAARNTCAAQCGGRREADDEMARPGDHLGIHRLFRSVHPLDDA
jgi:hypothetical protein